MMKIVIFEKGSLDGLPNNYSAYLDSFICNCIKAGDCRLSSIISNYTKDYDISKRPFYFSELYSNYCDNPYENFSPLPTVRLTFSSPYEEIIDAFCKGVKGKTFEVNNIKLKVLDILDMRNEAREELFSLA
ncbi:hypothetical protein CLLI_25390 [Clostridium liquoris]|uniref:Uncharacterized protein n=1 Tax=Clostridium liquoris TaxID=1289519 RepID=A0A2T0B0M8_9CLOT|nr:hypothetical protein [Clostridium liquoris]PRR77127.1 hypothetical protein CLLI_25390 [Clostridium liquoris]